MISKGFYFSSKIEKNKGDRDFNCIYFLPTRVTHKTKNFVNQNGSLLRPL